MSRNHGALVFPFFAAAAAGIAPGAPLAVGAVGYAASTLGGIKLRRATRESAERAQAAGAPSRTDGELGPVRPA